MKIDEQLCTAMAALTIQQFKLNFIQSFAKVLQVLHEVSQREMQVGTNLEVVTLVWVIFNSLDRVVDVCRPLPQDVTGNC